MAMRKKKIDYISKIDQLFQQWKQEAMPSASQQHEIDKHARVAYLRDNIQEEEE